MTGKIYIVNISLIEKHIIEKIPESLLQKINPNIIEKIDGCSHLYLEKIV